jgi:hypothetical protein
VDCQRRFKKQQSLNVLFQVDFIIIQDHINLALYFYFFSYRFHPTGGCLPRTYQASKPKLKNPPRIYFPFLLEKMDVLKKKRTELKTKRKKNEAKKNKPEKNKPNTNKPEKNKPNKNKPEKYE